MTNQLKDNSTYTIPYNEFGDEISHLSQLPIACGPIILNENINNDFIKYFHDSVSRLKALGCKVIVLPPVSVESYYSTNRKTIDKIIKTLSQADVGFYQPVTKALLPDSLHYDTFYHVNAEGRDRNTERLITAIKKYLN